MTVRVLTDSSACVPADVAAANGIEVVPIQVTVGDEARRASEIDRTELKSLLDEDVAVHTSGPTPGDLLDAIESTAGDDGAVIITISAAMSGTYQAARLVAAQTAVPTRVVDSRTAAGAHALVALEAARLASTGADIDAVEGRALLIAQRVRLLAVVGSLERLARSGRVPQLARSVSDAIGVKPLFEFRDGRPHLLMPSLAEERALERIVARCLADRPGPDASLHVSALHADRPDAAAWLLDALQNSVRPADAFISEFDAAMMVHSGTDVAGLAWWWG